MHFVKIQKVLPCKGLARRFPTTSRESSWMISLTRDFPIALLAFDLINSAVFSFHPLTKLAKSTMKIVAVVDSINLTISQATS